MPEVLEAEAGGTSNTATPAATGPGVISMSPGDTDLPAPLDTLATEVFTEVPLAAPKGFAVPTLK